MMSKFRSLKIFCWLPALFISTLSGAGQSAVEAQATAGEIYRLRVVNAQFGKIEVSTDAGRHYLLIGRVLRPASTTVADKRAVVPGTVLQSGSAGITLSVALSRIVRLRSIDASGSTGRVGSRHSTHTSEPMSASIVTNLKPKTGILGELAPQSGSAVSLETEHTPQSDLPGDYIPGQGDVLIVVFSGKNGPVQGNGAHPEASTASVRERIKALANAYEAGAIARAEAEQRTVASGFLKLSAKLPKGEPVAIAFVTYAIDGDMVAAENIAPFTYAWDTRRTADGEHVVEVRALDVNGGLITSTRALVAVHNAAVTVSN